MTPRTERLLHDLVEHAAAAARLVDRGRPAYDADEMLRYAAEDLLIRLGETVARIDRDDDRFVGAHPGLELRRLKDARNLVAHGYDIVDPALVWSILEHNVPTVAERVRRLLDGSA
ncbi:uncharacterized protein DUF86 [Isoptericola jiangsuensis]|uniref:Uncharacterized protein DUF86 n=1 Tax=Isoptericola jiangsuensis TaxID=548579 RepID=A0A2A9ET24_9MICO|nr:HepT-like ribonuclease domain-containing protein [Isoptericola jiangsuensis]PFG42297.1 uncharacterized protein DUF86 [Isoptericola jiangsuensis]